MVLARMLEPQDFGLVGMVTALMGVLGLFRDFGLSAAIRAERCRISILCGDDTMGWAGDCVGRPRNRDFVQGCFGGSQPALASISVGGCLAFALGLFCGGMSSSLLRLVLEGTALVVTYAALLLSDSEQRSLYLDLLRGFKRSPSVEQKGSYVPTM
jgi:hypothetical protein